MAARSWTAITWASKCPTVATARKGLSFLATASRNRQENQRDLRMVSIARGCASRAISYNVSALHDFRHLILQPRGRID
jgi:hypothetical protein